MSRSRAGACIKRDQKKFSLPYFSWLPVLSSIVERIGNANPETAPYGAAGIEALKRERLWSVITKKVVYGQSVAQAFQYAHSQAVDASFCALSSLDAENRRNLRKELKDLKEELSIPIIHVTHDLNEALVLGDDILSIVLGKMAPDWFQHQLKETWEDESLRRIKV